MSSRRSKLAINLSNLMRGALLCGLFVVSTQSNADARLDFSVENSAGVAKHQAHVQSGMISYQGEDRRGAIDMIFIAKSKTLYLVRHGKQSYYQVDESTLNQLKLLSQPNLTNADGTQNLIGTLFGAGLGNAEKAKIIDTGKTLKAANIDCAYYKLTVQSKVDSEVCIAAKKNLTALSDSDYNTLSAFFEFGSELAESGGILLRQLGINIPDLKQMRSKGLPIMVYSTKGPVKTQLTAIANGSAQGVRFKIPANYVREAIPLLG